MDQRIGLIRQFFGTAAAVLSLGMLVMGYWVSAAVEDGVKDNAIAIKTQFVTDAISPLCQELLMSNSLTPENKAKLDDLFGRGLLKTEVVFFQIWSLEGIIAYSNDTDIIGKKFRQTDGMKLALSGQTYADFDNVLDEMSIAESMRNTPLLEIYSPIRSVLSNEVIGVAEFYTDGKALREHLLDTRMQSWLVVASVGLMMVTAIYLVVANGAETIAIQKLALDEKVSELSGLLDENRKLSNRINRANLRLSELNESALRRLSADLHDGPLQLLSYAGLRLEAVNSKIDETERLEPIKQTVDDAMREIRQICRGLSLPEISDWNLATIATTVIEHHTKRTDLTVNLHLEGPLPPLPLAAKTTVYRFIQETLNNGAHHGACKSQSVSLGMVEGKLRVDVSDDGRGFDPNATTIGLGLEGLRERVNSLGGSFTISTAPDQGTHVIMTLPMELSREVA